MMSPVALAALSEQLATGVIYGISLGMLYALIALGLTLIFGLMDVINFAHGALVTGGAYVGLVAMDVAGSFWLALLVVPVAIGLLGLVIERGLVSQLYGENPIYQLVLTFGVALVLEGLIIVQFGQTQQRIQAPGLLSGSPVPVGPAVIPRYRLFIIIVALVLLALIWITFQRTKLGLIVKAGIEDRERTQLLGINLSRINMLIFALGSALAGLAGLMMAPIFSANPSLGTDFLIIAFVVTVVGGLGNVRGTIAAALLVGVLSQLTQTFYAEYSQLIIFLAMIVVLLIKPEGLFGGQTA